MEDVSSQQLTGKYNNVNVITDQMDISILIKDLQENRSIFNQICHI